jgi:hypothetical protein
VPRSTSLLLSRRRLQSTDPSSPQPTTSSSSYSSLLSSSHAQTIPTSTPLIELSRSRLRTWSSNIHCGRQSRVRIWASPFHIYTSLVWIWATHLPDLLPLLITPPVTSPRPHPLLCFDNSNKLTSLWTLTYLLYPSFKYHLLSILAWHIYLCHC